MRFLKLSSIVLLFVTGIAAGSASAVCSNATVTGVWGYQIVTAVGQFTADGKGNITAGSQTVNQNGTVLKQTFTGKYSVGAACTGSLALNFTGGGSATAKFVLDNSNKGAQIIDTTPGIVAAGTGFSEGTVTCGLSGKKATLAVLLLGKIINPKTPIAYVAQVALDGKGNVSGSGTFDVGGTIRTANITGTYTEIANCTGTIEMTPKGSTTLNFAFVVVNAGKELLLVETDSNSAVAGNMQQ